MQCRKCGRMIGWRMGDLCMACRYGMKKSGEQGKGEPDKPAKTVLRIPVSRLPKPPFPLSRPLHLEPKPDIPFEYEVTPEVQEIRKRRKHVQRVVRAAGSAQRITDTGREVPVLQEDGGDLSGWEISEYMSELY